MVLLVLLVVVIVTVLGITLRTVHDGGRPVPPRSHRVDPDALPPARRLDRRH